jgi:hypothetical protein
MKRTASPACRPCGTSRVPRADRGRQRAGVGQRAQELVWLTPASAGNRRRLGGSAAGRSSRGWRSSMRIRTIPTGRHRGGRDGDGPRCHRLLISSGVDFSEAVALSRVGHGTAEQQWRLGCVRCNGTAFSITFRSPIMGRYWTRRRQMTTLCKHDCATQPRSDRDANAALVHGGAAADSWHGRWGMNYIYGTWSAPRVQRRRLNPQAPR